jgi:monothiol glutaredoxin
VRALTPVEANARLVAGTLTLVDVRPAEERAQAAVNVAFATFDAGLATLEALPKTTALAFLCHHGGRSQQAAEHFRQLGFGEVYNITGGIEAWANEVDATVPRY